MKNTIPINTILERVCEYFNQTPELLISKNKIKQLAYSRQIYFYLSKKYSNKSFQHIGNSIKRHHATVQFSVRKITIEKDIYSDTKKHIEEIVNSFSKIDFIVTNVNLLQICINNTNHNLD